MREKSEYEHKLVDLARVARIVAGGKRFRFRAAVVLGNKNGKVGLGVAKGNDVSDAISKATRRAQKRLVSIPIAGDTIPYEIEIKKGAARVFLKPAKSGTGIIAGGAVRTVVELAGIKNILSKIKGSQSKINNVLATIEALSRLKKPDEIAAARGKKIEEFMSGKKKIINKKKTEILRKGDLNAKK
jgi:small subunit ribosomal protein S5